MAASTCQLVITTGFEEALHDFMQILLADFPRCERLASTYEKFDVAVLQCSTPAVRSSVIGRMITLFHKNMHVLYGRIYADDHSVVDDVTHPLFKNLDLQLKFDSYSEQDRACAFAHLKGLCRIAQAHNRTTSEW